MNRKTILYAGALALTLGATVLATGLAARVASAQTPTATTQIGSVSLGQTFWQALAGRLGISLDQLTQAVKAAGKDTTAQAVQVGSLTQSQADTLNAQIDQWQPGQGGPFGLPFGHDGFGPGRGPALGRLGGPGTLDAAAKALGMTTSDLRTELQSGKTLADVAKEKNVDANTVKQAIVDAAKAQVDQALADGRITQDQATQLKQNIDQQAQNLDLSQALPGGGPFGRGPFGPPPGNPNQAPAPQITPASSGSSL